MRTLALLHASALCLLPLALAAQQSPTPAQDPSRHDAIVSRGDRAMGFSHETTTHHFLLYKAGGAIDVSANDPKDSATRDEIRMHLSHIAKLFAAGDFDVPMFIHDTSSPGAPVMAKLRGQIRYVYTNTPGGAKIQITTANPEALQAIHAFLRFQIADHQTGDSTAIEASPL
jgi:hypothetical protein